MDMNILRRFGAVLLFPLALLAQNGTWTGSTGDYTNRLNWLNQTVPGASGIATFNAAATVNNITNASLGGIYNTAGTITLNGTALALINNPTLRSSGTVAVNLPFTGDGSVLTKSGSATVQFTQPLSGFSAIRVLEGEVTTRGTLSPDSPLRHAGGTVKVVPQTAPSGALLTASAYTLEPGPATLFLDRTTSGTLTAQPGNTLTRQPFSALTVYSSGGTADFGGSTKLFLPGGTGNLTNGILPWLTVLDTVTTDTHRWRHLATYDAVNGVVPFAAFASDFAGGNTNVVRLDSTTSTNFLPAPVSAYALEINGVQVSANLTLGDGVNPGVLLLNPKKVASDAYTPVANLAGSLNFGTSEGIIATGEAQYGGNGAAVNAAISGSGGLTIAQARANSAGGVPILLTLGSNNTYSGPTHLLGGRVYVYGAGAFGNSPEVFVHGDSRAGFGSELLIAASSVLLTNKFYVSGNGFDGNNPCSLRVSGTGSGFSGEICLQDDTIIRNCANSDTATTPAHLYGPLTGAGALTLYSGLTDTNGLSLYAPSTYVGDTVTRGYVYLRRQATLGQGTVKNSGILTVCDAAGLGSATQLTNTGTFVVSTTNDTVISTPIAGAGAIAKKNSGTLTFTAPVAATNFLGNSGDTLVNGGVAAFGTADTVYTIGSSSAAATVILGNAATNVYAGFLTGPVTLVKTGAGTLTLSRPQTYAGATIVSNGTLRLSAFLEAPLRASEVSLWLDASKTSSLKLAGDGTTVTNWADQSSYAASFKEDTGTPRLTLPSFNPGGFGGRGSLQFNGSLTNKLNATVSQPVKTFFILNQPTAVSGMDGLFGTAARNSDFGIRASVSSGLGAYDVNNSQFFLCDDSTNTFINGINSNKFTIGAAHLLSGVTRNLRTETWAVGNYVNDAGNQTQPRAFTGNIGEIIAYPVELTAAERQLVENYLMCKWGLRSATATNILPAATALTLADTGTLDLNGISQSFASVSGTGRIINSGRSANLTINSETATEFLGTIGGSNTLVKAGSGTLSVSARQAYLGGTAIQSGTLKIDILPPTNGLVVALDAANAQTNAAGNVTAWASATPAGASYTVPGAATAPRKIIDGSLHLPAVQFDGVSNRLYNSSTLNLQSLFAVNRVEGYNGLGGLFGADGDYGLRLSSATTWQSGGPTDFILPGDGGSMYINGVSGYSFTPNVPHIVSALSSVKKTRGGTALGWYYNQTRSYPGSVYEMLIFNRAMTASERVKIESYLNLKWLKGGLSNLLPTNSLYIAAGAVLDLGGTTQTVNTLTGSGSVTNGTLVLTGELPVTVNANGTCAPYTTSASLDLSKASIRLINPQYLRGGAQTVVEVTGAGTLTGVPAFANLPGGWIVVLEGKLLRVYPGGTLLLVR